MFRAKHVVCISLVAGMLLFFGSLAWAGGTVTYSDGTPAAGAKVIVAGGDKENTVIVCDANGRFEFGNIPDKARVHIKAGNKDYAPLLLPASLFGSGDVTIVLQPKSPKQ